MDLTALTDEELDQLRTRVLAERQRRHVLATAAQQAADLAEAHARAIADTPPRPIDQIELHEAVGPGAHILDTNEVEWINTSGAWLSPHTAGPDAYPLGWRRATPPDPADPETPTWEPGTTYEAGDTVSHDGTVYVCVQGHTALPGWEPPAVPALWTPA